MCFPPLVGREKERQQLRTAAVPGSLVLLSGAAGSGKTRLVRELPGAVDATVLTGYCPSRDEPFPFAPVIEALRRATIPGGLSPLCGALHPLMPEHAERLPPPPPPTCSPAAERHRTYRALTELMDSLGPTVLVLEDVHGIDPATRDLLYYLAPRLPAHLCLVLTYRPEELPRSFPVHALAARTPPGTPHHELALAPLNPRDLFALASRLLDAGPCGATAPRTASADPAAETAAPPPDGTGAGVGAGVTAEDAERLHAWTGGLALAAVETLHHLACARAGTGPGAGPAVPEEPPVPPTLRDWFLERLHALDRDTRHLVRAACVLEVPAADDVLARVADLGPSRAEKALSRACRLGLLRPAGPAALEVRTPLLRRVCHDSLPLGKHRHLHRAALSALSRGPAPPHARLARHAREAGLVEEWTDHAERAADQALSQGEDADAVTLLRDALTRPTLPAGRRCDLALKLGRAALTGISAQHTIALLRDVLATPGLPAPSRGELRMELGLLLLNQAAQGRTARSELVRAAAELTSRPDLAARAMCALAVPRSTPDPVDTHRRWMEQAVSAAHRSKDPAVAHSVSVNQATLLAQVGDPAAWTAALPDPGSPHVRPTPEALVRRREFARASLNLADAAVMLGHYERADRHLSDAATWSIASEVPYIRESAQALRLILDWQRGHWAGLDEEAERHLGPARLAHLHAVAAELTLVRSALALAQGDPAGARSHLALLEPAPGDDPAAPDPDHSVPVRAFAAGLLARLAIARGDAGEAWSRVEGLVSLVASKGVWVWAADLVPGMEALVPAGRGAEAQDLCARFRAGLRGTGAPAAAAALGRFEAALARHRGQGDRALHLYAETASAYRAMPRPYDAAQVREAAAHTRLDRSGDRSEEEGVAGLRAALEEYTALGAAWDAARVRRALRAHGVVAAPAGGRGPRDPRLSPREGEIAALAGRGSTNREIAALLHLSPRTVETHVANALAKLGLRSRRDLASVPGRDHGDGAAAGSG
ncbi:AAA family ATPase [Nocardiopsis sp. NPDC006198]|uniref:helix-turn-helix transcriptional regulator n=1 Tax=Nocardiopsis sp. NPDC006198 TaxID=3154472 RepID=UPI0033ABB1F0